MVAKRNCSGALRAYTSPTGSEPPCRRSLSRLALTWFGRRVDHSVARTSYRYRRRRYGVTKGGTILNS